MAEETHLEYAKRILRESAAHADPGSKIASYLGVPIEEFDKEDLLLIIHDMGRQHKFDREQDRKDFDFLRRIGKMR